MFDAAEIDELARRKRLLLAESELNRQALKVEWCEIQTSLAGVTGIVQTGSSVWRLLALATPLASLFVSRRSGKWSSLLKAALAGWQVFNRIQPLWAALKPRREPAPADDPPETTP